MLDTLDKYAAVRLYGLKTWSPDTQYSYEGRESVTFGGVLHRETIVVRHTFVYRWAAGRDLVLINQNTSAAAGRAWAKKPSLRPAGVYETGLTLLISRLRPTSAPNDVLWRRLAVAVDNHPAHINIGLWRHAENTPALGLTARLRLPGVDLWLVTGDADIGALIQRIGDLTDLSADPEALARHQQAASDRKE